MDLGFPKRKLKSTDMVDYGLEFCARNLVRIILVMLFLHIPVKFVTSFLLSGYSLVNALSDVEYSRTLLGTIVRFAAGLLVYSAYNTLLYPALKMGIIRFCYRKITLGEDRTPKEIFKDGFRHLGWYLLYTLLLGAALGTVC